MVAAALLYQLVVAPALWLATKIVSGFLLMLTLTIAWRAYKTTLVRQFDFLRRLQLNPIEARQAILITGSSSGIGLALAKHLHKIGYSVVATYFDQRDPGYAELKALQQRSEQQPSGANNKLFLHQLDVTNQEQVGQLYGLVEREFDEHQLQLYALINNAGLGSLQPFAWLQRRNIIKLIETNISGALLMSREFLPLLIKRKQPTDAIGRLVFVSSGLGFVPGATYATYGVTKSAHIYFSRCMNLELKERYGVKSVAVIPHNFIKNTNICAQVVQTNQLAWDELKPIERELYKREYDAQLERARSLEKATREHVKQVAPAKQAPPSPAKSGGKSSSTDSLAQETLMSVVKFVRELIACLQGNNLAPTLEESGALECFEDALRLANPPEQIFAGDSKFQLIIGSLLLSLPQSCIGLLSSSVAPSLYK